MKAERTQGKESREQIVESIMAERTPRPEDVVYAPTVKFLDAEGLMTREERAKAIAMGDRNATSYDLLCQRIVAQRGKTEELEGEIVPSVTAFYIMFALAARTQNEIAHTSILEQMNPGTSEEGGDPPIVVEGISVLSSLRDFCTFPYAGFESFSSRGGIFPEGYWRIPEPLKVSRVGPELERINEEVYRVYLDLTRKGISHYLGEIDKKEREKNYLYRWRVLSMALDDSRQVTNSSFLNHFAIHPNSAMALREMIVKYASSEYPETVEVASKLRELAKVSLPSLMRHTEPSEYTQSLPDRRRALTQALGLSSSEENQREKGQVGYFGSYVTLEPEKQFLAGFLTKDGSVSYEEAWGRVQQMTIEEVREASAYIFKGFGLHDKPPEALRLVQIRTNLKLSLGAIFDISRHRPIAHLVPEFTVRNGFVTPESFEKNGCKELYWEGMKLNETAYSLVESLGPGYAEFLPLFVARGHIQDYTQVMDAHAAFYLLKLRADKGSHPDVYAAMSRLEQDLCGKYPAIFDHLAKKIVAPPAS